MSGPTVTIKPQWRQKGWLKVTITLIPEAAQAHGSSEKNSGGDVRCLVKNALDFLFPEEWNVFRPTRRDRKLAPARVLTCWDWPIEEVQIEPLFYLNSFLKSFFVVRYYNRSIQVFT